MQPSQSLMEYFEPSFEPKMRMLHVLVEVEQRLLTGIQRGFCEYSLRPPEPLMEESIGAQCDFQDLISLNYYLADAIKSHFAAWKRVDCDERSHPLFLCLDGPGTGKTQLLHEFPSLLRRTLRDDKNKEMVKLLQSAFTFNIAYEDIAASNHSSRANVLIRARMLFQLQDTMDWEEFRQDPTHHVTVSSAFVLLSQLTGKPLREMCCPYILYLILNTKAVPWSDLNLYVPAEKCEDWVPMQEWDRFNCKVRVLKSMAHTHEPHVGFEDVHRGARFGFSCGFDRIVKETPRTFSLSPKRLKLGECSCRSESREPVFLYQPATESQSGGMFLCVEDVYHG